LQLGLTLRAARVKRRLRQVDLAALAGVGTSVVSRMERGEFERSPLRSVRAVAAKLGATLELVPRSAGGEFDRLVNARHAALGELVAAWITDRPGWVLAAEVSFSVYGERGIYDLLAWHEATGSLVVIELKTAIVDVDELLGTLDRKRRLAVRIAGERDWVVRSVGVWLVVSDSRINRRRAAEHQTLLASALPRDGRSFAPVFAKPEGEAVSGIIYWPNSPGGKVRHPIVASERVVRPRSAAHPSNSRSDGGSLGAARRSR
ncbi:MAG TPA: helix-turn-helix domain-containing protein, partial [Candidatus Limnocylindrales bacterium]